MTMKPHMFRFAYPARLTPDEAGRMLVEFPDFPFAATDGADLVEATNHGIDCLEEALAICIDEGALPSGSRRRHHQGGPGCTARNR